MTQKRRDEMVLRILKRIQGDVAGLKREMASGFAEVDRRLVEINRRLDGHRAFAVDRLRDHDRRLREQSDHLLRIDSRLDRLESF